MIFTFFCCSNPWATLSGASASANASLSPTAELDPLLTYLTGNLGFLSRALAPAPLRRIARAVLATISLAFWDNILSRHRFSTSGASQLKADLAAICRVVDREVGSGVAEVGLRKCLEGAQLIGLPVKSGKSRTSAQDQATSAEEGEDGWDAWGGEAEDAHTAPRERETHTIGGEDFGLWEVEKRLFADNQSAREVLDELGIEILTENEARTVFRCRVELSG